MSRRFDWAERARSARRHRAYLRVDGVKDAETHFHDGKAEELMFGAPVEPELSVEETIEAKRRRGS